MGTIDPTLALEIVREETDAIAYDTETNGVDTAAIPVGYVITNSGESIYVPVRHEAGGNIPNAESFEKALAEAFAERTRRGFRTVGHNISFDLRVSGRVGIYPGSPLEDTMINEALLDDLTVGYSLEECCKRHNVTAKLGADLYKEIAHRFGGVPDKKSMANFWRMPGDADVVVDYATGDGVSTLELWNSQQGIIASEGLSRVHELECALLPYVCRMHLRGMKIDHEYGDHLMKEGGHFDTAIKASMANFTPGFNVRSGGQVEQLFRANGYGDQDFQKTPSGKGFSFAEGWLKNTDIGRKILAVRHLQKARDSFAVPLLVTNNINGRVHAQLNQSKTDEYGVAGARFSCSMPNLQAFPKRNKEVGKIVRRLVIPDEGWVLEEADFKQQEPRLFAHYSEDPALLHGYRTGTLDMHDRSLEILQLDSRDTAKRLGMGMLTMMSIPTLAGHMGWDVDRARVAHSAFLNDAFPAIAEFQQGAITAFKRRGWVKSIMGRIARMDSSRFAYRAVSRIIQNSGGDHMKLALLRANQYEDAYPDKINILMTIHDSNLWQRDPGHDPKELVAAIENVATELELLVPIPVDLGSGSNWAEASYGK